MAERCNADAFTSYCFLLPKSNTMRNKKRQKLKEAEILNEIMIQYWLLWNPLKYID